MYLLLISLGTYITVKQISEKLAINKTKLLLKQHTDLEQLPAKPGHKCERCDLEMKDKWTEVLHSLEELENRVDSETMMSLVYVAGYVFRNIVWS